MTVLSPAQTLQVMTARRMQLINRLLRRLRVPAGSLRRESPRCGDEGVGGEFHFVPQVTQFAYHFAGATLLYLGTNSLAVFDVAHPLCRIFQISRHTRCAAAQIALLYPSRGTSRRTSRLASA